MIPFSNTLSHIIGFLFPAYASYKALKTEHKSDDKQWLTYWTIYAMLRIIELLLIPQYWSAYYYDLRLIFVIWLQLRKFRGAEWLFDSTVRPFFDKYEEQIDENLDHIKANAVTVIREKASVVGSHAYKIWQREDVQRTVRNSISKLMATQVTEVLRDGQVVEQQEETISAIVDEHAGVEESDVTIRQRRVRQLREAFEPGHSGSPVQQRATKTASPVKKSSTNADTEGKKTK